MSNPNLNPSLRAVVIMAMAASANAAGEHATGGVDMSEFDNVEVIASIGAFGASATGTLKFQQSKTADFAEVKDIENRTALVLVENMPAVVDLNQGELDINEGYQYVRAVLTATTESITAGLVVLGFDARHAPAEPMAGTVVDTRAA